MLFVAVIANAQSINIGNFYYRDYLDFGQNKGAFSNSNSFSVGNSSTGNASTNNGTTITGKNGEVLTIPNSPNFSASSNYGSLTSIGRGFVVTANHVSSPQNIDELRQWGLTKYNLANQPLESNESITGVSKPYGRDEKFLRFNKYIVEGQTSMLDIANSTKQGDTSSITNETQNLENFKAELEKLKDSSGNVYIYQAGSGIMDLRWSDNPIKNINLPQDGSMKGGGFGILGIDSSGYQNLVYQAGATGDSRGILYFYNPNGDFNNRITSGDSGSGIYAYDKTNQKWILLGVTSRATAGVNRAEVSFVSNKDFADYQQNFEQKINLKISDNQTNTWSFNNNTLTYQPRGDTPQDSTTLQSNKDLIFSGGGSIQVANNINRNISGYAGGFVFEALNGASSANPTKYTFTNANGGNYYFKGSGLDIGQNVEVEWHLRNDKNDALHKIGQGTLVIKTEYTPDTSKGENLGYLKIGEGKVIFDTDKKAYEGVYITSGRGEIELKQGKAESIGASKDTSGTNGTNSYTLSQSKSSEMGIYFGSGGGKLDLGGNSLTLNTIAANDSGATITNSNAAKSTLEIEGFGYDSNGNKTTNKADTIIHASIGQAPTSLTSGDSTTSPSLAEGDKGGGSNTQNSGQANIDIKYSGNRATQTAQNTTHPLTPSAREGESKNGNSAREGESAESRSAENSLTAGEFQGAALIFDGHINTSGSLSAENANIALQGHTTTHATISDTNLINQIKNAENGTSKAMPDYMDLSKPSTLNQPDWDTRYFKFSNGITLKSSNLTLGRNAYLESNISADSSSTIKFGGSVKHFIDNKDSANINGSGFGYYQQIESDALSAEMQEIANQTTHYKGTITADGGTIESHIWDFNASLDLQNSAKLTADFLTIEKSNTIKLASGTSATIKTLKLQNLSNSDLSSIFDNNTANHAKLSVTEALWFDSVGSVDSPFDLNKLDSTNVEIAQNYDIIATKSTITGTSKDLTANVWLKGANLTLNKLTLTNTNTNDTKDEQKIKNRVYLQGSENEKMQLKTNSLKIENLTNAEVKLYGNSTIDTPTIEFSSVTNGTLLLDSDSNLTNSSDNSKNTEVKGIDSELDIYISGNKTFDINASSTNDKSTTITLFGYASQDSKSSESTTAPTPNFSGKITASGKSSVVNSLLESITASVDLKDSAMLNAEYTNILLQDTYNSISLGANTTLKAQTITAKNLSNLTLNAETSANVTIGKFIFDGGTTNLTGNLIGEHIELKNASVVKAGDLEFKKGANLSLDSTSKLEVANLNVNGANLTLNLADSKANTEKLQNIDLKNKANLTINSWDFGNNTKFTSENESHVIFQNATYAQNGKAQTIGADSTISGKLDISNVGQITQSQNATTPSLRGSEATEAIHDSTSGLPRLATASLAMADKISDSTRFESLKFDDKNLSFGADSSISVSFNDSVKKGDTDIKTDGTYYKLISTGENGTITDNRTDKRIDFTNTDFFVVSKFIGNTLYVKFLESAPNTFGELDKNISHDKSRYSDILKALTEHNQNDEAIDIATRTDDYSVLDRRIQAIDSAMNTIAQGNKTRQTRNLLFSNDQTINIRIAQVRLAHIGRKKHLQFAQNDASYRIQSLIKGAVRSDAMPSYANKDNLPNSVWLNVGGGYFGGDSKMGFGATNIGYDRIIDGDNGNVLLGAMFGFGGSKAHTDRTTDSAMFYNIGAYLDSIFDSRGGKLGGHEIQGNLNFSINNNNKTIDSGSQSAKNTAFGTLFALYYKYNFIVAQNDEISHALKPVALLALGYNRNGAFKSADYKQEVYGSVNLSYGFGVEYNVVQNESFYSLALTLKDMAYSSSERVFVSLSGARNFIGYTLESAPRFSAEINLIGSHKLTDALYLQYGIAGMVDSGANYGAKGDIKLGYKF